VKARTGQQAVGRCLLAGQQPRSTGLEMRFFSRRRRPLFSLPFFLFFFFFPPSSHTLGLHRPALLKWAGAAPLYYLVIFIDISWEIHTMSFPTPLILLLISHHSAASHHGSLSVLSFSAFVFAALEKKSRLRSSAS